MSTPEQKPLPFIYQFAAGAVAGVSEVSFIAFRSPLNMFLLTVIFGLLVL